METHLSRGQRSFARRPRFETAVTLLMFVVTIGFTGYVVHQRFFRPTVKIIAPPLPDEPVTLDAAAAKGVPTAALVLIEYSDFHCPACLSFSRQTAPGIDAAYVDTGKLLRVYRHYPAQITDTLAVKTAEAATCAGRQGQFWAMHDALFQRDQDPRDQTLEDGMAQLRGMGKRLGLRDALFEECLKGQARLDVVNDVGTGTLLGVTATPTLFLGRTEPDGRVRLERRIVGAISARELAVILDSMLLAPKKTGN